MGSNKVTKNSLPIAGGTMTGALTMGSGVKLQFTDSGEYIGGDGTDLDIVSGGDIDIVSGLSGEINCVANVFDITSHPDTATTPKVQINSLESHGSAGGQLNFIVEKDDDGEGDASDVLGAISFSGNNDADTPASIGYVALISTILSAIEGSEKGQYNIYVQTPSVQLTSGLAVKGGSTANVVDVDIGFGTTSNTTIKGDMIVKGDTIAVDGVINLTSGASMNLTPNGNLVMDVAGHVEFDGCGVGFDITTVTYGNIVAGASADSGNNTDVDFRLGNKAKLTLTGGQTVGILGFVFPAVSGNFSLILSQDGSGTGVVTAYNAYESDTTDATGSATLLFSGGDNPSLTATANKVDIISIYWDHDAQKAYATASLNF